MTNWTKRSVYGLTSAIGEWAAALDTSPGGLRGVEARVALVGTFAATAAISFSRTLLPPLFGLFISTLALSRVHKTARARVAKAAAFWCCFSLLIMSPKIVLHWHHGLLEAVTTSVRVASSIATLVTCVSLAGSATVLRGMGKLGMPRELRDSLTLMIAHISSELSELSRLVSAKSSRILSRPGLLGEYGLLSAAASELFIRGPVRALRLSAVLRARLWSGLPERPCSWRATIAFSTLPLACLLSLLIEVLAL